jgi:hypothetical protein
MVKGPRYYRNKYDGTCEICGQPVPAGHGRVRRHHRTWYTSHLPRTWHGSPISGSWIGGCPPLPAEPGDADAAPPDTALTPEQARGVLYTLITGNTGPPRQHRDPGTDQGQQRMDEDCLRLAAMDPHALITDAEACATLLEIADYQGWT